MRPGVFATAVQHCCLHNAGTQHKAIICIELGALRAAIRTINAKRIAYFIAIAIAFITGNAGNGMQAKSFPGCFIAALTIAYGIIVYIGVAGGGVFTCGFPFVVLTTAAEDEHEHNAQSHHGISFHNSRFGAYSLSGFSADSG
jgi:hypothetical protein